MDKCAENIIDFAESQKKTKGRIDIIEIAHFLGIKVFASKEISYSSIIAFDKIENKYEIFVNAKENKERQRFSIAHEIAHFIQHQDKICEFGAVGRQNFCSLSPKEEKEADELAAKILMPTPSVWEYLNKIGLGSDKKISDSILQKMAADFEVSIPAMAIRLREMELYARYV